MRTGAVLLTRDLDFADVRQYPPQKHAGIVVLRLPDDATAHAIASIVERFVEQAAFLDSLRGRLAVIETGRVRFRPPIDAP
jgi:predicted nuclease of predicted toxin-antitoxin system